MASSNIARLGVVLGLDMAEFKANIDAAISKQRELKNEIQRHTNAAVKELYALTNATNDYGKELTKVEQIQREIDVGRFASATQDMKNRLLAQAAAYDAKVAAEKKSFDAGKLTMAQQQALAYQTTDLVTQIASGQNALIAMLQQGGQLKDSMGGFSNMFKVLAAQFTPFRVGLAAAAATIGTFAIAAYQGYQESDKLAKQLVLTGNYANLTQKSFLNLAATISDKTNVSIGKSRDILMQLASSGKVSGDAMESVATAMATVSRFTGETAEEVSQRLLPALSGGASSIKDLNDKMRFLTFEQYRQIAALDKFGQGQQAMKIAADALNAKLKGQEEALGTLQKVWEAVGNAASWAWNAMMGIGRKLDPAEVLRQQIDDMNAVIESAAPEADSTISMVMQRDAMQKQLDELLKKNEERRKQDADNAKKISLYEKAGGFQKELALQDEFLKASTENRYDKAILVANEEQRIYIDAEKQIALARQDIAKKNRDENFVFASQNAKVLAEQELRIERDKQEKIRQLILNSSANVSGAAFRIQQEQIVADATKQIQEARLENEKRNRQEGFKFAEQNAQDLATREVEIELQKQNALRNLRNSIYEESRRAEEAEANETKKRFEDQVLAKNIEIGEEIKAQRVRQEQLQLDYQLIGASQKEKELAESRLKLAQDIRDVETKYGRTDEAKGMIGRLMDAQRLKEQNIDLIDSLRRVEQVHNAVFGNMMNAIEQFVRTGKMSFKDLARSIIADLIMIQLRAQATALFGMIFGNIGTALTYGTNIGSQQTNMLQQQDSWFKGPRAAGGPVDTGGAYLVGEKGPELFMPRTAGTIVPNHAMGSVGGTTITNNYISAIDVKSFEDRILGSANAIWAASMYAQKRLPVGAGRM